VGFELRPNSYHIVRLQQPNRTKTVKTESELDLIIDLNTMDDTGLPWAFIDDPATASGSGSGLQASGAVPSPKSSTSQTGPSTCALFGRPWPAVHIF